MTIYAYIRVSTTKHDQTTDNQRKIISDNCPVDQWIDEDGVSGSVAALERPAFKDLMSRVASGDTVVCTMVDRLGRDAQDILHTVGEFKRLGVKLRVMQFDGVDVTSPMGKMVLTVMSALAEMEKGLIVERINAGISRTREQGTIFGRPMVIAPKHLKAMLEERKEMSLGQLSKKYGYSVQTIDRNIKKWGNNLAEYEKEYMKRVKQYGKNK